MALGDHCYYCGREETAKDPEFRNMGPSPEPAGEADADRYACRSCIVENCSECGGSGVLELEPEDLASGLLPRPCPDCSGDVVDAEFSVLIHGERWICTRCGSDTSFAFIDTPQGLLCEPCYGSPSA